MVKMGRLKAQAVLGSCRFGGLGSFEIDVDAKGTASVAHHPVSERSLEDLRMTVRASGKRALVLSLH